MIAPTSSTYPTTPLLKGTSTQHRVLGSLIQDFNGGDPDLSPSQRYLLQLLGDQERQAGERNRLEQQPLAAQSRRPHILWPS